MTMQIRRTATASNPPSGLAEGQLAVGMADTPNPSLWVGVPVAIDPTGRRLLNPATPIPVTSVFGRTGAVVAANGDYSFAQISGVAAPAQLPLFGSAAPGAVPAAGSAPASAMLTAAGTFVTPQLRMSRQVFTSSGTYTPPAGLQWAIVETWGGSGAGGSCWAQNNSGGAGSGGGQGAYSRRLLTPAQIGASQPVTIGAAGQHATGLGQAGSGGITYFGPASASALCSAAAGLGGWGYDGSANWGTPGGPGGGVEGVGDVRLPGIAGSLGLGHAVWNAVTSAQGWVMVPGQGGGNPAGQFVANSGASNVGQAGNGISGGQGAAFLQAGGSGGTLVLGGAGTPGLCVVTEFSF